VLKERQCPASIPTVTNLDTVDRRVALTPSRQRPDSLAPRALAIGALAVLLIAAALVFAVAKAGFGSDSNGKEKAFQGAGSIPATAGARVVMVREDDAFYGLARDRTLIANRAGANLYVRIHCDGSTNQSTHASAPSTRRPSPAGPATSPSTASARRRPFSRRWWRTSASPTWARSSAATCSASTGRMCPPSSPRWVS